VQIFEIYDLNRVNLEESRSDL